MTRAGRYDCAPAYATTDLARRGQKKARVLAAILDHGAMMKWMAEDDAHLGKDAGGGEGRRACGPQPMGCRALAGPALPWEGAGPSHTCLAPSPPTTCQGLTCGARLPTVLPPKTRRWPGSVTSVLSQRRVGATLGPHLRRSFSSAPWAPLPEGGEWPNSALVSPSFAVHPRFPSSSAATLLVSVACRCRQPPRPFCSGGLRFW